MYNLNKLFTYKNLKINFAKWLLDQKCCEQYIGWSNTFMFRGWKAHKSGWYDVCIGILGKIRLKIKISEIRYECSQRRTRCRKWGWDGLDI